MKSYNESVVEAMCSTLNSIDPGRHLKHERMAEESFIAWNRLGLSHESLDKFLSDSIRRMPPTYTGCRRKKTAEAQRRQTKYDVSQVVDRILSVKPRPELSATSASDFERERVADAYELDASEESGKE
ncbi:hypothetical protein FOL47_002863 [Perkinsus chesapeaki]|uniref:Uncharacterized protein n=1 Tax=Perkinsus chesapeaki TaxID=330153 RepID=A0A7J6KPH7_PERCH|nr:hypothetical protein FOL47_002863 [Perkinsus chesapeaki]